jgi:hypothetical protein
LLLALPARQARAASAVTFNHDVAPLVHANCATCHRDGETAPFPLLKYRDVRKHVSQIVDLTSKRQMPPWKAEHGFGEFIGERRLSDEQIAVLRNWSEQGCPEGDPTDAPQEPQFTQGWQLGTPDLVVTMPEAFDVPADGRDIYRCFVINVEIPPGKFVRATEYRPGNRKVVHHAVITTVPEKMALQMLGAEPKGTGPGFASGLVAPGERLPGPLGIWAPGKEPLSLPDGYAMKWPKGVDLVLQLHLHPSGKAESEKSSVGLYLTDEPPRGKVRPVVLLNKDVDIPAGQADYRLSQTLTLPVSADVIGLFPHMHLIGRTIKATATLPDGTVQPILSIADWDFNWQSYYQYAKPMHLPAGTRIDTEWTFDNSAANPTNPSQPPKRVTFGEQTTNEMGALILDVIADKPIHR